jgi:hypothetical protein
MKTRLYAALLVSSFTLMACPPDTPPGGDGGTDGGGGDGVDAGADVGCRTNEVFDEALGECVPDFGGDDAGDVSEDAGGEDAGGEDADVPCVDTQLYIDRDGDRYGVDDAATNATRCLRPDEQVEGYAREAGDCDDDERARAPGGVEFCDAIDNNCNDQINENLTCEFYANTRDELMLIDPFEPNLQAFGEAQVRESGNDVPFQDLETHPDGRLFAITRTQLYEYQAGTWAKTSRELGADGIGDANGFAIDRDGVGYVTAENRLYTVDMDTGAATLVGEMGQGVYSSGDCVVNKGNTLFMTSKADGVPDRLVAIDRQTAQVTLLEQDTGFDKIYALTAAWGILFGLTGDGEVIQLDERTGAGTLLTTFPDRTFFGSASTPAR